MSLCSTQIARSNPWTCLSCTSLTKASQALISGSRGGSPARIHQRKHSSSKASSSSKDDSGAIAATTEAPTKDAKSGSKKNVEKRPGSRISRQKLKDSVQEAGRPNNEMAMSLPSVPATSHLHRTDVHMSAFFSIHRPISVTTPIPNESSNKVFSSIFKSKPNPKHNPAQVMFTLSSAVDTLENVTSSQHHHDGQSMSSEEMDLRQAVTQASSSNSEEPAHLDLPAKTLHINLQELAKNFRPFNPPPAPVPLDPSTEASLSVSQDAQADAENIAHPTPIHKSYSTTLTIHESTYPNGQKTYKTHTTPIVEAPASTQVLEDSIRYLPPTSLNQPFLGRMRERQAQYLDRLVEREGWMAISVKRQRKLKMKKHKYKKLMKRTKNLRRKLDRN